MARSASTSRTLSSARQGCGRAVVEIASFNPPTLPRTYLVILWAIDTVTIRFKDVTSLQEARDFFAAYSISNTLFI
jgi:hypothetical protein